MGPTPAETRRTLAALLLLGVASGLPNELTQGTLQAWLVSADYEAGLIGLVQGAGTAAYVFKFLWSPLVDRWTPPWWGRRRAWLAGTLTGVVIGTLALGWVEPGAGVLAVALLVTLVAALGATYDLALNGLACDALDERTRATGAGLQVWGWRVGYVLAGAALALAPRWGWPGTFTALGALTLLAAGFGLALVPEPPARGAPPASLAEAVSIPLRAMFVELGPGRLLLVLLFALLYRIADGMAGSQQVTFLLKGVGFPSETLGLLRTPLGLVGAALGVVLATVTARRLGEWGSLGLWGVLAAVSNLVYPLLALSGGAARGEATTGLVLALLFDNACAGAVGAAMVGFMIGLCTSRCAATQYALLTAIMVLGRFLLAPTGYLAESLGWTAFWALSALAGLPGLGVVFLLWWTRPAAAPTTGPPGEPGGQGSGSTPGARGA